MNVEKEKGRISASVVNIAFCIAIVIAIVNLTVTLCIYTHNQKYISERYNNALADVGGQMGEADKIRKATLNIEYLERLHELHKDSTTTDLLSFIYGFLSTAFIGLGAYYVKNSKDTSEAVSEKCSATNAAITEANRKISIFEEDYKTTNDKYQNLFSRANETENLMDAMQEKSFSISRNYTKLEGDLSISLNTIKDIDSKIEKINIDNLRSSACAKIQQTTDRTMQILSMLISFVTCAGTESGGILQSLVYEFLPRIHEQMEWIKDEISVLTSEDCKIGNDAVLKSALNGIMYCAGQCKGRHVFLNEAKIEEIQQFTLDCVKKLNDKLIEKA